MSANPYKIEGPAIISFSGGRTSGYMLRQILDAHGGALPADVRVVFCNTGKERPETLDFVRDVGARWSVQITWLEYRWEPGRHYFEVVSHNSASRNGEPFDAIINARRFFPDPLTRFCSRELKVKTTERWAFRELDWLEWTSVIGLRADEPRRVAKIKARNDSGNERYEAVCPLAVAGVSKREVKAFWDSQLFDLGLVNANGTTPAGNCDGCFLKGFPTLMGLIRSGDLDPKWWIEQEARGRGTFRSDRPGYAQKLSREQGDIFVGGFDEESAVDCVCTE